MDRATFLRYSLATTVAVWAGASIPPGLGIGRAEAEELFALDRRPRDPALVFPQSVASGDPQPRGIVLWTRVEPGEERRGQLRRNSSQRNSSRQNLSFSGRGSSQRNAAQQSSSQQNSSQQGSTAQGGRAAGGERVAYEIARDEGFKDIVRRGVVETDEARDYTVKTQLSDVRGLAPFTTYYYRFIYRRTPSRTGRFKTLPAPEESLDSLRIGYISCQDYTNGYYNALGFLAQEDVDYVVHLGDYIYETVPDEDGNAFQGGGPERRQFRFPRDSRGDDGLEATTLRDYRFAYKKYRSDRNLQRVHENFALITIWDDHEFVNDGWGTHPSDQEEPVPNQPERRSAANQAWAEYQPVGVFYKPKIDDPLQEIRIYRSFAFGDLMELVTTDERLYRDSHPCGEETLDKYLTPGCDDIDAPGRTMLGETQKEWFIDRITRSTRTWKIWGNETMVMQLKLANAFLGAADNSIFPEIPQSDRDGVYLSLDQWDGYQAEREDIARKIREAGTENLVVITGDIHTFIAGYVKENYDNPLNENLPGQPANVIGTAFVCGSITSSNLFELALGADNGGIGDNSRFPALTEEAFADLQTALNKPSNPHFVFNDSSTHGYNLMEVTPEALTCTMKAVSTIQDPNAELFTLAQFRVPAGQVEIIRTDLPVPVPQP